MIDSNARLLGFKAQFSLISSFVTLKQPHEVAIVVSILQIKTLRQIAKENKNMN